MSQPVLLALGLVSGARTSLRYATQLIVDDGGSVNSVDAFRGRHIEGDMRQV